ncbi:MAG: hypothetical protein JW779_09225 [Candidatus Thorarchaeota archaeon]|nr:hypothetical protein [Candidatus Thorarchaeota archaeon]
MANRRIDLFSVLIWFFSSLFLLVVQLGYVSPVGVIVVSLEQYAWLFWMSVVLFLVTTANLVTKVQTHARWSTGFSGEIVRTVRIAGDDQEYFIRGASNTPLGEILDENWPFHEHSRKSKWYVVDERGNDVTNQSFSSLEGTASVVFEGRSDASGL